MKADIFSLGVVLWEIITLERPAWRGNLRDIRCAVPLAATEPQKQQHTWLRAVHREHECPFFSMQEHAALGLVRRE